MTGRDIRNALRRLFRWSVYTVTAGMWIAAVWAFVAGAVEHWTHMWNIPAASITMADKWAGSGYGFLGLGLGVIAYSLTLFIIWISSL